MSDAQIREWDSALTRCAALLVRSSYRDDISDEDADMLRDAVSRATRARDGLITRLRAAEARTAWQPIETLIPLASTPDGYVLAWSPHWGRSDVAWYAHGTWWTAGGRCEDYDMPTHGMPLPEAPHV